jgi:hypothetical protein
VGYTVRDVRNEPAALKELMALDVRSTPCIVIGKQVLVGFNPKAIDKALAESQA